MKTLRPSSLQQFEQALWRAGRREPAPRSAMVRTAQALGLSSTFTVAASTAAVAEPGAAAWASTPPKAVWVLIAKPLFFGLVGGLLTSFGSVAAWQQIRSESAVPLANPTPVASGIGLPLVPGSLAAEKPFALGATASLPTPVAAERQLPSAESRGSVAVPLAADTPPRESLSLAAGQWPPAGEPRNNAVRTETTRGSSLTNAPDAVSIAEQVAAIDHIREVLAAGTAKQALTELANYHARWPSGAFLTDAALLQIEAELALNDREAAKRRARAFIGAQPNNRYVQRVRGLFKPGELE